MGGFSVDKKFDSAVGFANDESIKKRYFAVFLFLVGELYAISGIGLIEMISEILDCPFLIFSKTSSTYRFHRRGRQSMGAVAMACYSRNSIKKLATMGLTGLPMAAPKRLYIPPRNSK